MIAAHQAEQAQEQQAQARQATETKPVKEEDAITFDDTSEFVRNVSLDVLQVKREPRATRSESVAAKAGPSEPVVKQEPQEETIVVKIETGAEPVDGDVEMRDAEDDDEEDEALAEMALRQGLSLEEMRLKMDADLQAHEAVKQEDDDVSCSSHLLSLC